MVKIQANTIVFLFTANSPITHVRPSRGRRITDAFMVALRERERENQLSKLCTRTTTYRLQLQAWLFNVSQTP